MAKLLLKKSSVDGNAAGTSDIDYGELAINYRNGRLFYKDNSNNIDNFIEAFNRIFIKLFKRIQCFFDTRQNNYIISHWP